MSKHIDIGSPLSTTVLAISLLFALGVKGFAEALAADAPSELVGIGASVSGKSSTILSKILPFEVKVLDILSKETSLAGKQQDVGANVASLELKETKTEIKIELSGDILFDFDKSNIRAVAEPTLKQVAEVILKHPNSKVNIDGFTDSKGKDEYNLMLSQQRADSVKNWLALNAGLESKTLSTKGWGEAKPVAPNSNPDGSDNPDGRQKNRRVEITVKKG